MSTRSALAGLGTTAILVAVLGSPPAQDEARDASETVLAATVTGLPSWDVFDGDVAGGLVWSVVIRLAVLLVVVTALCGVAGRSRSRAAGLLAGWGAAVVAAAAANGVAYAYLVPVVFDGRHPGTYLDGLVSSLNSGAAFGLWAGWVVGLAVALAIRPVPVTDDEPFAALAPAAAADLDPDAGRHVADPPPPWWAPTGIESTVFGHAMPPVATAGPDIHVMATATGDPHPSDPGVAGPAPADRDPDPDPDPDATQVEGDPAEDRSDTVDPTAQIPRRTE
jgi:hypothetical protein